MNNAEPSFNSPTKPNHHFIIQAINLSKRFNREWIFKDLSLEFSSGHIYAVTGPNGSGKSTLLQVLWGQVPQTSGELRYTSSGGKIDIDKVFKHIAVATPYMELIKEFTLLEHLQFHFKVKDIRAGFSLEELLEIMYLQHARHKVIANFSSGMKQRLKLALAFYTEADVIFLDEPGTNLDKQAFAWYVDQLNKLPKEKLVFIASNDPNEYPERAKHISIQHYK